MEIPLIKFNNLFFGTHLLNKAVDLDLPCEGSPYECT